MTSLALPQLPDLTTEHPVTRTLYSPNKVLALMDQAVIAFRASREAEECAGYYYGLVEGGVVTAWLCRANVVGMTRTGIAPKREDGHIFDLADWFRESFDKKLRDMLQGSANGPA